ncbi:hypothetical protein V6767_10440 [Martelella sp. FLE1502]
MIAAVTADFFGEVKAVGDFVENQRCSVAILNACRGAAMGSVYRKIIALKKNNLRW